MRIVEFLKLEAVSSELQATTKAAALQELAELLARGAAGLSVQRIASVLEERERLGSTGVGEGVAIPHGKLATAPSLVACLAVSRGGIDFESLDGKRAHVFFALVAPENSAGLHLKALARISRLFKNSSFREAVLAAPSPTELYALIAQEDTRA